jgi:lectin-like protein
LPLLTTGIIDYTTKFSDIEIPFLFSPKFLTYIMISSKFCKFLFFIVFLLSESAVFGQDTYLDNFSVESYTQNNGNQNFSGSWDETGDNDNASSGSIEVILGSRFALEFKNIDGDYITRSLDLSAATSVTLTLDYDRTNGNESLLVQLYNGSSYNTVATLSGTGSISYDLIASEMSSSSAIRFITGSGNWGSSETIYVDNVMFSTTGSNDPPVLTATGDQAYCPGTTIPVVETISITDTDDTTTSAAFVQISSGYINGEDTLTLSGSHPNITSTWDVTQGELALTGPATYTEFEAAILAVEYSSSSSTPTGTRQFSITVGEANYLPFTGHYYEFVPSVSISWTDANTAANARSYFGLQGYLATLTSQEESDFSGSQATGVGWIGASDATTEGDWQWVTGPEAGTSFWSGGVGGTELTFAFWNSGEPNNVGNEDYGHITDVSVTTQPGSWNDLPNAGGGGAYQSQGYVVEYGGTSGDPTLNITEVTSITIDNIDPTASNPLPITVYCTVDIPVFDVTVVTDEADNCTANPTVTFVSDVGDGGSDPEIITRTYRITDASGNSTDVSQTITVSPFTITTQPIGQIVFVNNNGVFTVGTNNADTYQWQVSTNGGGSFSNVSDGTDYSGTQTDSLTVNSVEIDKTGYIYRVQVSNAAGFCSAIISNEVLLTVGVNSVLTNRKITHRVNKN